MNKIIKVELRNGISINFKIKIYTAFKFLLQMFNGTLLSVIQTKNWNVKEVSYLHCCFWLNKIGRATWNTLKFDHFYIFQFACQVKRLKSKDITISNRIETSNNYGKTKLPNVYVCVFTKNSTRSKRASKRLEHHLIVDVDCR